MQTTFFFKMIEGNENCEKCRVLQSMVNEKIEEIESLRSVIRAMTEKSLKPCKVDSISERKECSSNEAENQTAGDFDASEGNSFVIKGLENEVEKKNHDPIEYLSLEQDYVFDENLKVYYSPSTGYYYDQNRGLLYEPQSQTYYKYDYSKKLYEPFPTVSMDARFEEVTQQVSNLNLSRGSEHDGVTNLVYEVSNSNDEYSNSGEPNEENFDNAVSDLVSSADATGSASDWQTGENTGITVTDLVKEVVAEHFGMSDYVYNETYQMYYSSSTGYFYDAIQNLLYEPYSGTYYKYDREKQTYELHCTPPVQRGNSFTKTKDLKMERKSRKKKTLSQRQEAKGINQSPDPESDSSPEEGEIISSSSSDSELDKPSLEYNSPQGNGDWPPCVRAVVEQSTRLRIGSLLLITCIGGILGRERDSTLCVPDISVSKAHAEITFNYGSWEYSVLDLGSQNGTFVNENRLSKPKERSKPHALKHGDRLALGSFRLLLHIHDGTETCPQCEPGLTMAEISSREEGNGTYVLKTKEEKEKERRQELKKLKKKYGLEGMKYQEAAKAIGYEDRAQGRRNMQGSQNPYEKDAEAASVDRSLSSCNKGYQLLKKMGWSEGQTLGAAQTSGILEPIAFRSRSGRAGLGAAPAPNPAPSDPRNRKWLKAQQRYSQLPGATFPVSSNEPRL